MPLSRPSWKPGARHLGAAIVTRDSRIIAYGESGQVGVIAC
jgi:deoxycytidylate deaminase